MNKKSTTAAAVVFGVILLALILILVFINTEAGAEASVYKLTDLVMDSKQETSVMDGKVTGNMTQSVKLAEDERLARVFVQKGDSVKAGDPLIEYDTKGIEIEIKNRQKAITDVEISIYKAQKELDKLLKTKPTEKKKTEDEELEESDNSRTVNEIVNGLMKPYKGNGTKNDPFVYLVAQGAAISANYIEARCIGRPADRYEILEYRENNKFAGLLIYAIELRFKKDGTFDFNLTQTEEGFAAKNETESYTAVELSYKISEKQLEIENLNNDKIIAVNEYNRSVAKLDNAIVYAEVSGIVKSVIDERTAKDTGKNLIDIVGKSGWFVQGYISELQLGDIKKGDSVLVTGAKNNIKCKGTVVEISEYPSINGTGSGNGNSNASYYPFTVEVSAEENLQVGDELRINIDENAETVRYILKSFVREENGVHYVLVRNKSTKLLERKTVDVGKTLYGEYIEVKQGLSDDDWLAFPYGKSAKIGAKTVESNQQELFGEMY